MDAIDAAFWMARRCLREPIPEIAAAQALLDEAANAHLAGHRARAAVLIAAADVPQIREWTDTRVPNAPPKLPIALRPKPRHPDAALRRRLIARDGYHCRFCGIPVMDRSIRILLRAAYPEALGWGSKNRQQHAANPTFHPMRALNFAPTSPDGG